jgi:hypothetical protein
MLAPAWLIVSARPSMTRNKAPLLAKGNADRNRHTQDAGRATNDVGVVIDLCQLDARELRYRARAD